MLTTTATPAGAQAGPAIDDRPTNGSAAPGLPPGDNPASGGAAYPHARVAAEWLLACGEFHAQRLGAAAEHVEAAAESVVAGEPLPRAWDAKVRRADVACALLGLASAIVEVAHATGQITAMARTAAITRHAALYDRAAVLP